MSWKKDPNKGFKPGVTFASLRDGHAEAEGVAVPEGDYDLTIESVAVVKEGTALRPMCRVVGGPEDGTIVCCGMYHFAAANSDKRNAAIRNVKAWGVTDEEIRDAADLAAIGDLLVGRSGRVELGVAEAGIGPVNVHKAGAVELTSPLATTTTTTTTTTSAATYAGPVA